MATLLLATPLDGAFHLWNIREVYTDSSGTRQFIEFFTSSSSQQFVGGQQVRVSDGTTSQTFTIPSNLPPSNTANRAFLIGTASIASSGSPSPNYVIPNGFILTNGGTITFFGANSGSYTALPTDGILSRTWGGGNAVNSPQNFAGQVGSITNSGLPSSILISNNAVWRYLDNGLDAGAAWRSAGFDDSSWASGAAQLGYGDGDEATTINGGPVDNHYITTYFRRSFSLPNAAFVTNVAATILFDDGAVVYLNGTEVFRVGMPLGDINYQTLASAQVEDVVGTISINPGLLVEGTNVIAVEVHQALAASADLSFQLALLASSPALPDADFDGMPDAWEMNFGLNPANAADALSDLDNDGMINRDEYRVDTDPSNPASYLGLVGLALAAGNVQIQFATRPGLTYAVQYADSLDDPQWTEFTPILAPGTSTVVTDVSGANRPHRFYRVWGARTATAPRVSSVNVAGFANISIPIGSSFVTVPFFAANHTVPALIPYPPADLCVLKEGGQDFNCFDGFDWFDPGMVLNRGERFLMDTPATYVLPFVGQAAGRPVVIEEPVNRRVTQGESATFTVATVGDTPLRHQWLFNGSNAIPGATSATWSLANVQPTDDGFYSCVISNVSGLATSAVARLTVLDPPPNCPPSPPCLAPLSGLVGWWSGEGSAMDSVNRLNGTIFGNVRYTNGYVGQGFYFGGALSDFVEVPDHPLLNFGPTSPLSVSMWLYRMSPNPIQHFLGKRIGCGSGVGINYQIWVGGSGNRLIFYGQSGSADTGVNLPMQTWTHLVGTFDGQRLKTYVNGVRLADVAGVLGPPNGGTLRIGGAGTCNTFQGIIDEVALFNRALSSTEVADIFCAANAGMCLPGFVLGTPRMLVNGRVYLGSTATVTNTALVQLEPTLSNTVIRYTLNGAPPAGGILFTGAFVLNQPAVLRAMAFGADGFTPAGEADPLMINVVQPPAIVTPPQGRVVGVGGDVALNVVAAGTEPLAFQWRRNGVAMAGATNAMLLLTNIQPNQGGNFAVAINNALGAIVSPTVAVVVLAPPSLLAQPQNVTVGVGGTAMFSVSATGPPPLEFQWRKNGVNIPGATNSTFTIPNVTLDDGASYSVVVASPGGTIVSDAARLAVLVPSPPAGDNFASTNTLLGASGAATGTNNFATREAGEPLHAGKPGSNSVWYTWTAPARGIVTFRTSGSTFDTLLGVYTGTSVGALTTVVSDEDSGGFLASKVSFNVTNGATYHVAIDGFNGQQGSYVLRWELVATDETVPEITCQPANRTAQPGQSATFAVSATGGSLAYQWLVNGTNIVGATNSVYTRTNAQPTHVGFCSVRVTSSSGHAVESAPAILEIGPFDGVVSKDKPDDVNPTCPGGFAPATGGASSVAMGSLGSQLMVSISTNNLIDCNTTNCGGIPRGTRYLELTPSAAGTLVLDTMGSAPRTKIWVCRAGTNNLDRTRSYLTCDVESAPDGRSIVSFAAEAGRIYQVWVARLDDVPGDFRLNWRLGLPPRIASMSPHQFAPVGSSLTLSVAATNVVASGVTTTLSPPSYAWYFNGTALVAVGPTLTLNNLTEAHAGQYRVVIGNDIGSTSAVVRIEVFGSAARSVVSEGGVTELFADATTESCGSAPARYQWRLNNMALIGETNRSLILRSVQSGQAGQYSVTVSNCFGVVTYPAATVAVTVDLDFSAEVSNGQVILRWQTSPTKNYRVEIRGSLGSGDWLPLGADHPGTGGVAMISDPLTPQPRFYRIVVVQ